MAKLAEPGSEVLRLAGLLEEEDKGNPVSAAFGSGIITTGQQPEPLPFYAYDPRERERVSRFGGIVTPTNPAGTEASAPADASQAGAADSGFTGQTAGTTAGSLFNIPEYNVNIPGFGQTDIAGTATNLLIDQGAGALGASPVPGVGILSTLINPTIIPAEEVPWGTAFNTGGGGLIGALGAISYNNLVDIYEKTQAGEEGYQFYAPGDIPGLKTPIGISPDMFGFGSVVSGNTDLLPSQADINNDGQITSSEVQEFSDPNSAAQKDYLNIQENKAQAQQDYEEYIKSQEDSGGSGFVGGTVVTDSKGNAVTSIDEQGNEIAVTSGGTFTNFGASPEVETSTEITSQGIMDAITSGMENASANQRPEGAFEVASSNITMTDASPDNQEDDDPGKSIVCTEMYRQTQLDDWGKAMKIWDIYQKRHLTPFHEVGYHWLFKPYVKGMRKSKSMTQLGAFLARERTQHLKYVLTKGRAKDSLIGNVWCKIIHPIVYLAGKVKKGDSNG